MKFNLPLKLVLVIIIISACNSQSKDKLKQTNDKLNTFIKPIISNSENTISFSIATNILDTIVIRVKKEHLKSNDGYVPNDSVFKCPEVFLGNKLIFTDEEWKSFEFKINSVKALKVKSTIYILLKIVDVLYGDRCFVIEISDNYFNTHDVISKYFKNLDQDEFLELGGFYAVQGYRDGSDSGYYNPAYIFELNTRFLRDSTTSKRMTLEKFEKFHGYQTLDKAVPLSKKYLNSEK